MPRKMCLEPAELPGSRGNRPDGPTTLEGVLDLPRRFLADLARHDLVDNASMTLQHGVVCGGVDFGTLARRVKTKSKNNNTCSNNSNTNNKHANNNNKHAQHNR